MSTLTLFSPSGALASEAQLNRAAKRLGKLGFEVSIDEAALLKALDSGHLGGCALDVGRAPDQMPAPELARHPLVLASPHIGGLTLPAVEHQALETVSQLASLLDGKTPVGAVNAASATRLRTWGGNT